MKQKIWKVVLFLLCLGSLYAQTPGPNESVIHVSRTNVGAVNLDINVLVDGQKKAEIDKQFVRFVIPNGQHAIQAVLGLRKSSLINFTAQSQEIVFVVSSSGLGAVELRKTGEKALAGISQPVQKEEEQSNRPGPGPVNAGIEEALYRAANAIMEVIPDKSTVAVLSISSRERDVSEFIIEELTYILVDSGFFKVVDRKSLDTIRGEQNFQSSGDVDDDSAVDIGKMLGANVVITGSAGGIDSMRRLRLKALNVKTAEILAMASERY
ncbi:MAG: CsgG/HfaB family protein [Treponema sp.]|nr:CsgG/HfaB family protein [Treponema sp.]